MFKTFSPPSWNMCDDLHVALVKSSSRGIVGTDFSVLEKRAGSEFAYRIKEAHIPPDVTPVHLIAMGASDTWGLNRNYDGWTRETLKKDHDNFVKFARWYRNHVNKDPKKSYGHVKLSHYNDQMDRVELLVFLNNNEKAASKYGGLPATEELHLIHANKDIPVSMACFTDPTYPILTRDHGYIPIADVKVGDWVWTHKGRWRRVTELKRRKYTGTVYSIEVVGLPKPLVLTANHPMYAVQVKNRVLATAEGRYFVKSASSSTPDWVDSQNLDKGDRLISKAVTRYPGHPALECKKLAALFGYYIAKGSFCYSRDVPSAVQFSCNVRDSAITHIPALVESLWPDTYVGMRPDTSPQGVVLTISSTALAGFIFSQLGRHAHAKRIAPCLFNATEEVKLSFLGAWLDGNGWLDYKGAHWSTCNYNLALQGRDLLMSLGLECSIYKIDHKKCKTSGKKNSGIEYTLNLSHKYTNKLVEFSVKASAYEIPKVKGKNGATMSFLDESTSASRIRRVTESYVSDITVYNFEVEEDESYTAGGIISHNCKIAYDVCLACGNKAKTRKDYCKSKDEGGSCTKFGCAHGLGTVGDDGFVQGVDNPSENYFFDISKVGKPAERTAYGFLVDYIDKEASDHVGGAELAEQYNFVTPLSIRLLPVTDSKLASLIKVAYRLASIEEQIEEQGFSPAQRETARAFSEDVQPELDVEPLLKLGGMHLPTILAEFAKHKIAMPFKDFVRLLYYRAEAAPDPWVVKSAEEHLPGVYTRLIASPYLEDILRSDNPFVSAKTMAPLGIRKWAEAIAPIYSLKSNHVEKRAILAGIRNKKPPVLKKASPIIKVASLATTIGFNKEAESLARYYGIYKLSVLNSEDSEDMELTAERAILQNYVS